MTTQDVTLISIASGAFNTDANNQATTLKPTYVPIASSLALGGIKVGTGLTIAGDGTLNATGGGGLNWTDYVTRWTTIPFVLVSDNSGSDGSHFGNIISYTPPGETTPTVYRFISLGYNPTFDAFYSTYTAATKTVSGLITRRSN